MTSPAPHTAPSWLHDLGHGVWCIDTGFERDHFDAAYLVVDQGRAAFIDCGHNAAVPRLLGALGHLGLAPEAVDWVIPTHVHLDHAGGAGLLMQHLPQAKALIHPRGARHLINPVALIEGAQAVYGVEAVRATYGEIQPIPAERVMESADGQLVQVGNRALKVIDTPGHARHHHCVWDAVSRTWFTGDTFGISYRELDTAVGPFLFPTTTPVQFEPDAMRQSVARMVAERPARLALTHYNAIACTERTTRQFLDLLDTFEREAIALDAAGQADEAGLKDMMARAMVAALRGNGSALSEDAIRTAVRTDLQLNAQGLRVWLDKRAKGKA